MRRFSCGARNKGTAGIMQVDEALKAMVEGREDVGPKQVAAVLGISPVTVYQYAEGKRDLPARLVPGVTLATGSFLLLDSLEAAVGRVGIPLPSGEDLELGTIRRVMREFAELVETACSALEDGTITAAELGNVRRDGIEAIAAIHQLISEFELRAREGQAQPGGDGRSSSLAAASRQEAPAADVPGVAGKRLRPRRVVH